jgi:hypothetical protein
VAGRGLITRTEQNLPPAADVTRAVAAGDVDGDGDVDLVFGVGQDRLLVNDGRGLFRDDTATRLPLRDDATRAVLLTDTDRDGDLDLITAAVPERVRLLANLAHHAHAPRLLAFGAAYDLELFVEPWAPRTTVAVPFAAATRLASPLATPFGLLGVDVATLLVLPSLAVSGGVARLSLPRLQRVALRGLPIHWQAVVDKRKAGLRMTNVVSDRVGR